MGGFRGRVSRKTRKELELTGAYRKTRHGDLQNPEPEEGQPEIPDGLDDRGAEEWARMLARLSSMKAMWKVDDAAIYQYCQLFSETERIKVQQAGAEAAVAILEQNIGDVKGEELVHLFSEIVTLRKLIAKCTDQLRSGRTAIRQFLVEFALTPASRGRVKLNAGSKAKDDAFADFQGARVA